MSAPLDPRGVGASPADAPPGSSPPTAAPSAAGAATPDAAAPLAAPPPSPVPSAADCRVLADGTFAGRSVLVTGAGSGIGRAIALRLVALGADVTGVGRREEALAETARLAAEQSARTFVDPELTPGAAARHAPGTFSPRSLDVRDGAAVTEFVARLGDERGIDVLVNNAGGQFVAPATTISERGMAAVLDLNLTAIARLMEQARPYLVRARGSVVTISLSAPDRGIPGLVHSATARAAIVGLTRALAEAWRDDGVALHCLAPGTVLTDGVREELEPEALARTLAATPLGRDTTLPEIAEWVAALACGAASGRGGALIEIDGGAGLRGAAGLLTPTTAP